MLYVHASLGGGEREVVRRTVMFARTLLRERKMSVKGWRETVMEQKKLA